MTRSLSALASACALVLFAACSGSSSSSNDSNNNSSSSNDSDGSTATDTDGGTLGSNADDGGNTSTDSDGGTTSTPGSPTTLKTGSTTITMTVAGKSRTAIEYVPASATSSSAFVIALHGDGDTDTNFLATSGLKPLADKDGFVMIVPQGITRDITVDGQTVPQVDWDAYNTASSGNIDLPFLEALRAQVQATGQVDKQKTFVFGYSQGGYMAFNYGLTYATDLSCLASLAASSPFGGGSTDPLITGAARKIPVAMQIGTEDSAYAAAQQTDATLKADGFPQLFTAVQGAGHVPIPGDVSTPLNFCLGQTL